MWAGLRSNIPISCFTCRTVSNAYFRTRPKHCPRELRAKPKTEAHLGFRKLVPRSRNEIPAGHFSQHIQTVRNVPVNPLAGYRRPLARTIPPVFSFASVEALLAVQQRLQPLQRLSGPLQTP
jgi:hypothetical protein